MSNSAPHRKPVTDESADDVKLAYAAERIEQLVAQAPGCSIGVLTRRNATVKQLIYELRTRNVAASEEGGNPLTDSTAVQVILSLLRLADHPGDTIARFHVAQSPLAAHIDYRGLHGRCPHAGCGAVTSALACCTRDMAAPSSIGPSCSSRAAISVMPADCSNSWKWPTATSRWPRSARRTFCGMWSWSAWRIRRRLTCVS